MPSKPMDIASEYTKGLITADTGMMIPPGSTPDCLNVEDYKNALRRAVGLTTFTTSLVPGVPLELWQFVTSAGVYQLICITTQGVYRYSFGSSPSEWVEMSEWSDTPPNITDYLATASLFCTQMKTVAGVDSLIFTDWTNAPREYSGSAAVALTVPSGFKCKYLANFFNHLVAGYVYESSTNNASRLKWSILGDPETWTGTGSGYVDLIDTPGEIKGLAVLGDTLLVFKDLSIYSVVHTNPPAVFYATLLTSGVGCIAPQTITPIQNGIFFLGNNNIWLLSQGGLEAIGDTIKELIWGDTSIVVNIDRSFGLWNPQLDEWWLFVPTGTASYPDYILRYSPKKKRWYPLNPGFEIRCAEFYTNPGQLAWNAATDQWEDATWDIAWLDASEEDKGDILILMTPTGESYYLDVTTRTVGGAYPTAYRDTQDIATPEHTRLSAVDIEAYGVGTLNLHISTNRGDTWTDLGQISVNSTSWETYTWWMNRTDNVVRFRVVNGDGDVIYRRMKAWLIPRVR